MLELRHIDTNVVDDAVRLGISAGELDAMAAALRASGREGFRILFVDDPDTYQLDVGRFKVRYRLEGNVVDWIAIAE